MNFDWNDVERQPASVLKLMNYIRGYERAPSKEFIKRFEMGGVKLTYYKSMFDNDCHVLEGKDWKLHFRVRPKTVIINNHENFRRDIALLKLFGLEELLSRN